MLNPNKRDSILQWFNCISIGKGVQTLKDFANFILFYQIIISLSPVNANKKIPQNVKPIESTDDKHKDPFDEASNLNESLTETKEHTVYHNTVIVANYEELSESNAYQLTIAAPDTISETSTSSTIIIKSNELDEIEKTGDNSESEIIQNGPTQSSDSIDDVLCNENVDGSLDIESESDKIKSEITSELQTNCEKEAHDLSNGSCQMEISPEDNFLKPVDVNHTTDFSTNENNSVNQHDLLISASSKENSRTESFENNVNDSADESQIPDIENRYEAVKTFIDGMLDLKSEELVNYQECTKGNEFELAKITVLFLCAWLQSYLLTDNYSFENTICHLHQEVQEEIKECLELFLIKRTIPIKRREFHDVLIRTVRPRSSPRWSTPVSITPAAKTQQTRKSRSRRNVQIIEDVTIESSPLKSFLQSPDLRHITPKTKQAVIQDAISRKNKEISELYESLEEERYKNKDLEEKIENCFIQLRQLREEKAKLKGKHNEELKFLEEDKEILLKEKENLEEKNKILKQQIEQFKEDLKFLKTENHQSTEKAPDIVNCNPEESDSKEVINLKFHLTRKSEKIERLEKEMIEYETMKKEFFLLKTICETHLKDNMELQQALISQGFGTGRCKIRDLTIRNDLQKDFLDLKKYSEERDYQYKKYEETMEAKCQELNKNANDWKAKFRKAERERENVLKTSGKKIQKLELTIAKLTSQIEAYKNTLNVEKESNCETSVVEKIDEDTSGQLWLAFTANISGSNEEVPNNMLDQRKKSKTSFNSYPLLHDTRSYRKREIFNESSHAKLNISCADTVVVESTNGRSQCSESELKEIKTCVMNVFKAIENKNIKTDKLPSNIDEYERSFESVQDLINALVLFYKIIQEDFNSCDHSTEILKDNINDSTVQNNHKFSNSICEVSEHSPVPEKLSEKPLEGTSLPNTTVELLNDKDQRSCTQKVDRSFQKSLELAEKLASLKLKIKRMKKEYESNIRLLQEHLTKTEDEKNKSSQILIIVKEENENLNKRIQELEKIIKDKGYDVNVKESNQSEKKCEKCLRLIEKLNCYKIDLATLRKNERDMKFEIKTMKQTIIVLKENKMKLEHSNKSLEESVTTSNYWNQGNFASRLMESANQLGKSVEQKKLKEMEDDWEENPESINEIMNPDVEDDNSYDNLSFRNSHTVKKFEHLSAFCHPEDEEDILNESSISDANPKNRLRELQWRNSLYLPHMRSIYPLELNTTPTVTKYTKFPSRVPAQSSRRKSKSAQYSSERDSLKHPLFKGQSSLKNSKHPGQSSTASISKPSTSQDWIAGSSSEGDKHASKRRKVAKSFVLSSRSGHSSQSIHKTPKQNSSTQKIFKTPTSFFRLMNQRRRQR